MTSFQSQLSCVTTSDGLVLDGLMQAPQSLPSDYVAFLIVHGTGGIFYSPGVLESFADAAVSAGQVALRINTRGHYLHAVIPTTSRSVQGGASFERVRECVFDIAAWIDFLVERGCPRIVLVGHSMGGVKAAYSQAKNASPHVVAVACLSPPRFCHQHWMQHPKAVAFRASYQQAAELVESGAGRSMIESRQPLPLTLSAESFIDKYGPADSYDLAKLIPELSVPICVLVGEHTISSSPAFDSWPAHFAASDSTRLAHFEVIGGADMNFSNNPTAPFDRVQAWLGR